MKNILPVAAALLLLAVQAHASIKKPKSAMAPAGQEVYEATEDEVDHVPPPRPLSHEQISRIQRKAPLKETVAKRAPKPSVEVRDLERPAQQPGIAQTSTDPREAARIEERPAAPSARQPRGKAQAKAKALTQPRDELMRASTTPAPAQDDSYDAVPSDQMHPLVMRIHLVEEILRKHARAYDYRTHTIRELEDALAQLDAAAQAAPPVQAAPAKAPLEDEPSGETPLPTPPDQG